MGDVEAALPEPEPALNKKFTLLMKGLSSGLTQKPQNEFRAGL